MADIKVRDLTDTSSITLDNQVMVLTNDTQNQVQNITVENLLSNVLSSDNGNVLEQGTDGKLYVETPENITGELADLSTTDKSSLVGAINEVDSDLTTEVTNRTNAVSAEAIIRANADNNLQSQIDAITAASDVTDIVGTYAQLQAYDTTGLANKSVIKVLQDESRENETTYYRWVITDGVGAWVLIGEEGPYYTISQADSKFATKATVGDLNNLATSDKSSIVNAMNELASVLDPTQTANYIKNSKAIYSGEVSENALILPQIKEMAHSTFDLSKFTKVGNPIVTEDGIASGFTASNYITKTITDLDYSKDFDFISPVATLASNSSQKFFILDDGGFRISQHVAKVKFSFKLNTDTTLTDYNVLSELAVGDKIQGRIKKVGTNLYLYARKNDGDWIGYANNPIANVTTLNANNKINFGFSGAGDAYCWDGSLNLRYMSITVDGVPVFSGNKTGIDTIKPDDYTVYSAPSITNDGMMLADPNGSIYIPFDDTAEDWRFEIDIDILNTNGGRMVGSDDSAFQMYCVGVNGLDSRIYYNDTYISIPNPFPTGGAVTGKYSFYFQRKNGAYNQGYKLQGGNWVNGEAVSSSQLSIRTLIRIGAQGQGNFVYNLNTLKYFVNGELVTQGCLKIPYTESKTGSKIVDSIYRDRVDDMANQFGYAPYYTLSDTDFTLPQGELYGYLEKRARDIAHPVGVPFYRFSDEINDDEVRLEGAEVDKGLYLAIEEKLSALCTAGSTDDKICLPDFRNRVAWGASDFGYVEAGLPNITGKFGAINTVGGFTADGAFYDLGSAYDCDYDYIGGRLIGFDASRSSSIYKNDITTVQPPAVKVRWLARWK